MAEIVSVYVANIDVNPFRELATYPFVQSKLEALMRSFADVGMWEGVIGRRIGDRIQCAFGHHRIEAARRAKMVRVPMILRDLSDEQMLQFMGRENLEDYNADFLCMLESWDAAFQFLSSGQAGKTTQPIAVARLLGWIEYRPSGSTQLNNTARACHAAHSLIAGSYLNRADLVDMPVNAARAIVERAQSRIEELQRIAKTTKRPTREIERAKIHVGKAAKETVRQYKKGQLRRDEVSGQVDVNAYRFARKDKQQSPLFAAFGKSLADSLARMLHKDATANRLDEVSKALADIVDDEDKRVVQRIQFELEQLSGRTTSWGKRLIPSDKKIARLITKEEQEAGQ